MKNLSFEELELAAYHGEPMPDKLPLPDQMCYLCLRCLYDSYRVKRITKQAAVREKKAIRQGFEENREDYFHQLAMYAQYQEDIRVSGMLRSEILKGLQVGEEIVSLLEKACECIGKMTGDMLFPQLCRREVEKYESKHPIQQERTAEDE